MPNHIHGILVMKRAEVDMRVACQKVERFGAPIVGSLPTIVRSFKASVSRRSQRETGKEHDLIWQRNYYEHVVRNQTDLDRIRAYIQLNPQRWENDKSSSGHGDADLGF